MPTIAATATARRSSGAAAIQAAVSFGPSKNLGINFIGDYVTSASISGFHSAKKTGSGKIMIFTIYWDFMHHLSLCL
jgi:hypothetical protein